jgi:uncharacterized protein (TIGR00730 family)
MNAITVYCGSSTQLDATYHNAAEVIGQKLGKKGLSLVYGGGRIGLMGEVASSAAKNGATVVGVITHKLVAHEQANEACDELIVVNTMQERRTMMMERGDAFLVLPGGVGTYEEMFEVLVGRQLGDHSKPIGIVNIDGYFDPLIAMLNHGIEQKFIRDAVHKLMYIHSCPKNVLDHITTTKVSQPSPEDILPMHG